MLRRNVRLHWNKKKPDRRRNNFLLPWKFSSWKKFPKIHRWDPKIVSIKVDFFWKKIQKLVSSSSSASRAASTSPSMSSSSSSSSLSTSILSTPTLAAAPKNFPGPKIDFSSRSRFPAMKKSEQPKVRNRSFVDVADRLRRRTYFWSFGQLAECRSSTFLENPVLAKLFQNQAYQFRKRSQTGEV